MSNHIILVEDQREFADNFIREAKAKNINVAHKSSLDGLKTILPRLEHKFTLAVLDIKCLLHEDQEIEDANFIGAAISYLDQTVPGYPRLILTGDETEFATLSRYYSDEKIFLKTPQGIEELFTEVQQQIDNSEINRLKRKNAQIFEIFDKGWMDDRGERQLLKIIKQGLTETNFSEFKGIFADIRSMQEWLYKTINSRNSAVVPDSMFRSNGMIHFTALMRHLSGKPDNQYRPTTMVYQNNTIKELSTTIYWSCGEYIHEDPQRTYFVSAYTVKALTYALLEILLWSKQYM